MGAPSITRRWPAAAAIRNGAWWQLPWVPRCYVGAVPLAALAAMGFAAAHTSWRAADVAKFCLLLGCGLVSVAATPRIAYGQGALVRDFLTVWVLPVAILLPPFYAIVTPVPLLVLTQWRIHRGVVYRRVFTAAAVGLCYGAAAVLFRTFPGSFAGGAIGTGRHALTWVVAVTLCELAGERGHHILIRLAIRLSDPAARLFRWHVDREALQADLAETDLAVLVTVAVAIHPVLAVIAVPTAALARRFMMHAQLVASSRIDAKTGLLNAATWDSEAAAEITRAVRTRSPLSVALIDIDHFKAVNDTHGHLVGDMVLRAVSDALRSQLRVYDVAGRFGGEEFVILLPETRQADALRFAERLRGHVAAMAIPAGGHGSGADRDAAGDPAHVRLTVSIGVAALDGADYADGARLAQPGKRVGPGLSDLIGAADAALYAAKRNGRNQAHPALEGPALEGPALKDPAGRVG
jgi:diguanylate cyclase (GGDEF)-like protein